MRVSSVLRSAALALALLSGCASLRTGELRSRMVPAESDATVALVRRDSDGDVGAYCTGVWVSPTVILTAAHCVKESKLLSFITKSVEPDLYAEPRAQFTASVRTTDLLHDLALLDAAPIVPHGFAVLASLSPAVGDDVTVIGSTIGLTWSVSGGTVQAYRNRLHYLSDNAGPLMQLQSAAFFGNSGGPVFDMSGHLVGILVEKTGAPTVALAVHRIVLQKFLTDQGVVSGG